MNGKNIRIDETNKSPIHCKALKCREHGEKGALPVGGHLENMKKFGNCPIRKSRRVRAFYGSNSIFLTAISGQTGSLKTKRPMPGDSPTHNLSESAILIFQIFNGKIQIFNEIFQTLIFVKTVKVENLCIDEMNKSPIHCIALKCREHGEKGPLPVGRHLEKMKKFGNCPIRKNRRVRAFYGSNSIFLKAISGQTGS